MSLVALRLCVSITLVSLTSGCSVVPGYRSLKTEEMLVKFDLIVVGTDMRHVHRFKDFRNYTDSEFQVSCVLKNDSLGVKENITILGIYPLNTCQSTYLTVGQSYIIGLKRSGDDYVFHEVDILSSVALPATDDNMKKVFSLCGLRTPTPPSGPSLKDKCPYHLLYYVDPCPSGKDNLKQSSALKYITLLVGVLISSVCKL